MIYALFLLASLAVQSPDARLTGRVPQSALPGVHSLVSRAARDGLPTEPLVEKALEGGAKHITAERIVAAVAAEATRLRTARDLLRRAGVPGPYPAGELKAVSAALARGLPTPVVERVVGAVQDTAPAFGLHAVADLAEHGFAPDSAADLIVAATGAGLRGLRLLDVAAAAEREVQRGRTRGQALAQVRAMLPDVPAPAQPPGVVHGATRPGPRGAGGAAPR